MYDSRELHTAFLLFLFLAAAYNGASFYLRDSQAAGASEAAAAAEGAAAQ
jgi:uncharacterized membrane protein